MKIMLEEIIKRLEKQLKALVLVYGSYDFWWGVTGGDKLSCRNDAYGSRFIFTKCICP